MTATKKRKKKSEAVFRLGYSCTVDPATAHDELERIRKCNGDTLRAADVVDESRPAVAPLHPVFTWDDEQAAELWRQDEARRLIRNVCVVIQGEGETQKARPVYIHTTPEAGRDTAGYRTISAVMADDNSRRAAILDALAQLRGWQKRYGWLKELASVSAAIDAAERENVPASSPSI